MGVIGAGPIAAFRIMVTGRANSGDGNFDNVHGKVERMLWEWMAFRPFRFRLPAIAMEIVIDFRVQTGTPGFSEAAHPRRPFCFQPHPERKGNAIDDDCSGRWPPDPETVSRIRARIADCGNDAARPIVTN